MKLLENVSVKNYIEKRMEKLKSESTLQRSDTNMRKQRDEKGRFLPGNQVALKNRGNRSPKYGNQNAKKHGFYSKSNFIIRFQCDGSILVYTLAGFTYLVHQEEWARDKNGRIWIADEAAEHLKRIGVHLEQSQKYQEIADTSQPISYRDY